MQEQWPGESKGRQKDIVPTQMLTLSQDSAQPPGTNRSCLEATGEIHTGPSLVPDPIVGPEEGTPRPAVVCQVE